MQYQQVAVRRRAVPPSHVNVMANYTGPAMRRPMPRMRLPRPPEELRVRTADIVKRLDVTTLAVTKWRAGSNTRDPLPAHIERVGNHNEVYFLEAELLKWLRVYRPDLYDQWQAG